MLSDFPIMICGCAHENGTLKNTDNSIIMLFNQNSLQESMTLWNLSVPIHTMRAQKMRNITLLCCMGIMLDASIHIMLEILPAYSA